MRSTILRNESESNEEDDLCHDQEEHKTNKVQVNSSTHHDMTRSSIDLKEYEFASQIKEMIGKSKNQDFIIQRERKQAG